MSRINSNVMSLIAQRNLQRSNNDLQIHLQRLSTGLAITRGADDPSGLIVSERLRSEIAGVRQAIDNSERAANVIATTDSALEEIASLLNSMRSLAVEAANSGAFSKEEIEANQLQIDFAVDSITRISNTTSFAGLKTLNGSLDYIVSGVNAADVTDLKVHNANFGLNASVPVTVEVLNSAETAGLFIPGDTAGAPGMLLSSVSFEVQGAKGVDVVEFVSGTALSAVVFRINSTSDATGVKASLVNASNQTSGMTITSTSYGSDAFVSVRKIADGKGAFFQTFSNQGGSSVNRDVGEDVLALINGSLALGDGLDLSFRTPTLNLELTLSERAATTAGTNTFSITGGGANYQIGPSINSANQVGFGVHSVAATRLGTSDLGFLNSIASDGANALTKGKAREAEAIINTAIDQISIQRGRLGAFERNTLQTTLRSQQIALENLTASESDIRDADFAAETAALTRAQILVNAGTSTLALANSSAQNVLALLQ